MIFIFIKSGSFQSEGTHFKAVAMGDVYKATEVWVGWIRSVFSAAFSHQIQTGLGWKDPNAYWAAVDRSTFHLFSK